VREAVETGQCQRIALILLDTGWGHSNEVTLKAALDARNLEPSTTVYFPSTVGKAVAGSVADTVAMSGADCAILLANAGNGAEIVSALAGRVPHLRVFSHWGITGGSEFVDRVGHDMRSQMQFKVLQTCGLRREAEGSAILTAAISSGVPGAISLAEVPASTGFVHGYDLAKILIAAARQAAATSEWQGDIASRRRALKTALESLEAPVEGILKRYTAPFSPYSAATPDAHEALGLDDLCFARFTERGTLEYAD
jgi:branched-chain amino acid transport system substrate-binding protein